MRALLFRQFSMFPLEELIGHSSMMSQEDRGVVIISWLEWSK